MGTHDAGAVPPGEYCYQVVTGCSDAPAVEDERFGYEVREGPFVGPGSKMVLCPYWRRTGHGTVRCELLGMESVCEDQPGAWALARAHFGSPEAVERYTTHSWQLPDMIKVCGLREDEDE